MFFPHRLKKEIPAQELLDLLNRKTWADGGKFELLVPDPGMPFAMGYIVYAPCEDYRFATQVACYNAKQNVVYYVKAAYQDLSSFVNQMAADKIGGVIGAYTGAAGLIAAGVATGSFKKRSAAKKLAKRLNKELAEYLTEKGLW